MNEIKLMEDTAYVLQSEAIKSGNIPLYKAISKQSTSLSILAGQVELRLIGQEEASKVLSSIKEQVKLIIGTFNFN